MDAGSWTGLEVAQLAATTLVPVSVAGIGFWISQITKRLEANQWLNQQLVERRIIFVDAVSARLNDLYCYYLWIGGWKEISPAEIITWKRELDRTFNINRPFLTQSCLDSYQAFIRTLFETYAAPGRDALLRTTIRSPNGDRSAAYPRTWQASWNAMFARSGEADHAKVIARYDDLIHELGRQVGWQ
ncbi:hypothetical protein CC117_12585 [Parafrankia colletiae]|uniref:Uncharacterized protein n=1 Tax=Parafrankia colletiae TaxID=573497 RepID=A0A1S1R8V9_9ACTN|nr:hypothetical protein [Parafrankia colletiae]MCK9900148.1 hypothetical protein [Frankia sp. Cpl3]OHV42386.1 hypothetical protein CC117_12585 [Parafrankia colletiae]